MGSRIDLLDRIPAEMFPQLVELALSQKHAVHSRIIRSAGMGGVPCFAPADELHRSQVDVDEIVVFRLVRFRHRDSHLKSPRRYPERAAGAQQPGYQRRG